MIFKGLTDEQKTKVIRFNKEHLCVLTFDEDEAISEAEKAIMNSDWNCNVELELSSSQTKSGNPETLSLGLTNDFYSDIKE